MPERRPSGRFTVVACGLVIALALVAPGVVAADTGTVISVGVNASVIFSGSGFTPNETLSVWTTAPDGTPNPIPSGGLQTDANGGFSVTISFPSAGQWQATAHSINTGKEVVNRYAVGTTSGTTTSPPTTTSPVTSAPAPVTSGTAAPTGYTPVASDALVTFSGTGFTANEAISIWETPPNGSTPADQPGTRANSTGAFSVDIRFPFDGNWQITAQGSSSGKQVVGRYAVGTAGATTAPVTSSPLAPGAAAPGFTPIASGASVTFSGSGFDANELISLWETPPGGGTPTGLPGTGADSFGGFTYAVTFPSDGNWQITAHGKTSAREIIGRYAVGSTAGTTVAPAPLPGTVPVSGGFSNVPPVTLGSPVTFSGTGFNGGEPIALWDTAPDSTVATLPDIFADGTGAFTTTVTFPSAGNWQITAHGRNSTHEVIGRYTIVSDASATTTATAPTSSFVSPTADVPIKATAGPVITFSAAGFTPGEVIAAWSTGPNAQTTPITASPASSTGRATISFSFSTTGFWQVTLQGKDSGRTVIGKYQVSEATQAT